MIIKPFVQSKERKVVSGLFQIKRYVFYFLTAGFCVFFFAYDLTKDGEKTEDKHNTSLLDNNGLGVKKARGLTVAEEKKIEETAFKRRGEARRHVETGGYLPVR